MTSSVLAARAEHILIILRAHPDGMSSAQLGEDLGLSADQARRALDYLRKDGLARVAVNAAHHSRWVAELPGNAPAPEHQEPDQPYTLSPSGRRLTPKDEE